MDEFDTDEMLFDDDDAVVRRHSPLVRVVALTLVAALVLSAAWVLIAVIAAPS